MMYLTLANVQYIPAEFPSLMKVRSRLECASYCLQDAVCITMIYNFVTRDCYFYHERATAQDELLYSVDNRVVMYNTNRGK